MSTVRRPRVTRLPGECAGLSPYAVTFGCYATEVYARDEHEAAREFCDYWNLQVRRNMSPEQQTASTIRFAYDATTGDITDSGPEAADRMLLNRGKMRGRW